MARTPEMDAAAARELGEVVTDALDDAGNSDYDYDQIGDTLVIRVTSLNGVAMSITIQPSGD